MDLRVERTYRSLVNEFMKLMEAKHFEEITVAELCEAAMIRRTTFYKHFADKNEFLVFFVKDIRDQFAARVEQESNEDGGAIENSARMFKQTLAFLSEHGRLVDNALASQSASMIIDALGEVIRIDLLQQLRSAQPAADAKSTVAAKGTSAEGQGGIRDPEMFAAFIAGGIVKMAREWCEQGRPTEMEQRMIDTVLALRELS